MAHIMHNTTDTFLQISRLGKVFMESLPESDFQALNMLMHIEDILDKGRIYMTQSTEEDKMKFTETVENMDALRLHIRKRMDMYDQAELREFMMERGRSAQNQFTLK
jgi:hypothetical protein